MVTIGVALAVPEPRARQLQDYRTSIGDGTAAQIPTHITLVPPVEVADDELVKVGDHLARVAETHAAFRIRLRGTGTFRPVSPVVFVALAEGISGCEQLAEAVRRGPLAVDLAFPYHPHVTVAHHLPEPALDRAFDDLADFEFVFTAREFHLYVHDPEHGWRPRRTFRLAESARPLRRSSPSRRVR